MLLVEICLIEHVSSGCGHALVLAPTIRFTFHASHRPMDYRLPGQAAAQQQLREAASSSKAARKTEQQVNLLMAVEKKAAERLFEFRRRAGHDMAPKREGSTREQRSDDPLGTAIFGDSD